MKIYAGISRLIFAPLIPFSFLFIECGQKTTESAFAFPATSSRTSPSSYATKYAWINSYDTKKTVYAVIDPPEGYSINNDSTDKFACWLQHLPLKDKGSAVLLFNGAKKARQDVHACVVNIDVGKKDLQQCADAVIRLRAEYLFSVGRLNDISFDYTSGDKIPFKKWSEGFRPVVSGNKVTWLKKSSPSSAYAEFKNYLWNVFNYAGSKSLSRQLTAVRNFKDIRAGDVLIVGGFPGHAMSVIETATNKNGKKIFLLAQSYMPAQEIHIVKNFNNSTISPWYEIPEDDVIETPEWIFKKSDLMRWP